LYENLPVYKKTLDLTVYFEKIESNFSRYHKYTVGAKPQISQKAGGK